MKPRGLDWVFARIVPERMKVFENFVISSLDERMAEDEAALGQAKVQEPDRKDFLYWIFRTRDPETGQLDYTPTELVNEVSTLAIAGTDTTSSVLCAFIFYITRNERAHKKLTDEIRTTFRSTEDVKSGPELSSCTYLRAVLNETMRMNPAALSDLGRMTLPGGLTIGGEFFPEGIDIGTSLYVLHHDKTIFSDPFAFQPERWIVDEATGTTAEDIASREFAFAPFSLGTRGCVGKNLAYLELSITIAKLLLVLDVRRVQGEDLGAGSSQSVWGRRDESQFQTKDAFISLRDGPIVQFRKRKD